MEQSQILDQLRNLEQRMLEDVVRQDQHCPDFILTSSKVDRLSSKGMANPDGLFLFSGTGYDPARQDIEQAWSVVLKILQSPEDEGDITNIWYWKRELLAFQSGLLGNLPPGSVKAPRFYGSVEQDSSAWIWMEHIHEIDPPRWSHSRFLIAAGLLGGFNGAYLSGAPLPEYAWLSHDQGIGWAKGGDPHGEKNHPTVQEMFTPKNYDRLLRLWDERERFFQIYHSLPQVFSHCDTNRRNQLFRKNAEGGEDLVFIDWAWCGIAPVGWDLSMLLVDSTLMYELDSGDLPAVEKSAFPKYLEGLRSSGWQGDSRLVRLGYCASATLFPLLISPRGFILWSSDDMQDFAFRTYGCRFDELAVGWRVLFAYLLDLGEEALALINELSRGPTVA